MLWLLSAGEPDSDGVLSASLEELRLVRCCMTISAYENPVGLLLGDAGTRAFPSLKTLVLHCDDMCLQDAFFDALTSHRWVVLVVCAGSDGIDWELVSASLIFPTYTHFLPSHTTNSQRRPVAARGGAGPAQRQRSGCNDRDASR
jgi:hypothetical protein